MAYALATEFESRFPSLKGKYGINDELDAATRWIDHFCHRSFTPETSTSVRYFAATDRYVLDLGPFEISTNESVVVATDDGAGTYATTVASTSYQLEPVNAPSATPDARPFTSIRALNTYWPMATIPSSRQERIKVTAKYGWPAIPATIKTTCITLAALAYENPDGVSSESIDGYSVTYQTASGVELGVPRRVIGALAPYRRGWVA